MIGLGHQENREEQTVSELPPSGEVAATGSTASEASSGPSIILGLVPWFLFTVIAEHGTLKLASIASVVIAAGVCVYSSRDGGRPKMLEIAAVFTFIGFTIIAFIADPSTTQWLTRYARAIAAGILALLVFGSLLFVPFTEEYARQMVPREHWSSPGFKEINRRLTVMWGGVFVVMTASHVVGGALDRRGTNVIFNWLIPIALVLWGIKRSTGDDSPPAARRPNVSTTG
jgi:uncharacterized membrane protein YhaH (DUF805 family)